MGSETDKNSPGFEARKGLCNECLCITPENLTSKTGYIFGTSRLASSRSNEYCRLCRTISRHLSLCEGYRMSRYFVKSSSSVQPAISNVDADKEPKVHRILAVPDTNGLHSIQLEMRTEDKALLSNADGPPFPFILTNKGDPATKYGIKEIRIPENTSTEESFEFIRTCMERCTQNHNCSQHQHDLKKPARLLNLLPLGMQVSQGDVDFVQLQHIHPDPSRVLPRYMTLSHCWGGTLEESMMTKQDSLKARTESIPIHTLSLTFQHAIAIARKLGVFYLWIDALCIIQDSTEDWAKESIKMGDIYSASYLTVAAEIGPDSSSGCFNRRSIDQSWRGGAGDIVRLKTESGTLLFWTPKLDLDEPAPLKNSPLSKRGWAFQERMLSPRIIHFTRTQLVWECRDGYTTEDGLPFLRKYDLQTPIRTLRPNEHGGEYPIHSIWYEWLIQSDYAKRTFTRFEDRLIAISGIAKLISQRSKWQYLAGLWGYNIAWGLYWSTTDAEGSERRPTWSWTSHNGIVNWPAPFDAKFSWIWKYSQTCPPLKLLNAEFTSASGSTDRFGPLVSGILTISAVFGSVTVLYNGTTSCNLHPGHGNAYNVKNSRNGNAFLDRAPHPKSIRRDRYYIVLGGSAWKDRGDSTRYPANRKIQVFILLLERDDYSKDSFKRIGKGCFNGPSGTFQKDWLSHAEVLTIRLV